MDNNLETVLLSGVSSVLSEDDKNCVHQVVRPIGFKSKPARKDPVNIKFSYKLDPFQQETCNVIDIEENVLVAAHTSAGKTTVADYAIQACLDDKSKVIYTSPIKALSNQKYRDIMDVHSSNVGLMTGDACYNQEAAILIMTTEILHSILFKGSQLLREVKWVIFDEVHYMRDKERGVVWEETIVLLPESVKLIFLSATIPNSIEFANWIAKIKNSPCHVISTNFRPTPLRHYLFPSGGNHLILVQNELRKFQYNNVKHALESINETDNTAEPKKKRRFKEDSNQLTNQELDIKKLLNLCISSKYLPIIVFAFSKKEVENNAQIFCNLDLTTEQEKIAIEEVYNSALEIVSSEDRKLPQFSTHLAYLRTGIGVHHGGLLPIIKEITEILFQENLLKILFSTETFSMGINMPARSVIFTGLQKFDGERQRMITPGEYTQMSGRAGRRGIDTRGYSIVLLTSKYKEEQLERLFTGSALMLSSQFYLKYSTILNLLRIQGLSPMFIIKKSFFKFQLGFKRLQLEEDLKDLNKKIANLNVPAMYNTVFYNDSNVNEDPDKITLDERILPMLDTTNYDLAKYSIETYLEMGLSDYYAMVNAYISAHTNYSFIISSAPETFLKFLSVGRVISVFFSNMKFFDGQNAGFGIILGLKKLFSNSKDANENFIEVLLLTSDSSNSVNPIVNFITNTKFSCSLDHLSYSIINIGLSDIILITKYVLKFKITDRSENNLKKSIANLITLLNHNDGELETLDFEKSSTAKSEFNKTLYNKLATSKSNITEIKMKIDKFNLRNFRLFSEVLKLYFKKIDLIKEKSSIMQELTKFDEDELDIQLHNMINVLRKLNFIDETNVPTQKGVVCCDIKSVDCLYLGEIIFNYKCLDKLSPPYIGALLSILIDDERIKDANPTADKKLMNIYKSVCEILTNVNKVILNFNVKSSFKSNLNNFSSALMMPTFDWLSGKSFSYICSTYKLYEGTIVRSFKRIEEVLQEACSVAHLLGSTSLEELLIETLKLHRHGIIFTSSLYLVE